MSSEVTVREVRVVATQPEGIPLVTVKVLTSEPGLYGVGCATFTQRWQAVVAALESYLAPLAVGRPVNRIEDFWQVAMHNGYWRNGPIQNNAISGLDQALWDIKGKMAGMSVADLLGGPCREAARVYVHASGDTPEAVLESALDLEEQGYRYIRVQQGGYGGTGHALHQPACAADGTYYDPREYCRETLVMLAHVRGAMGDRVELLHDIHERLQPVHAVEFARRVDEFGLFFLEDALAPEDIEWFEQLRAHSTTPVAMGELFNHPLEWTPLIERRQVDYLRMHVSQIGGITPARQVVLQALPYNIKTAWHGPGDTSPVGHAANLQLDLWAPNFGIQEWCRFGDAAREVFPGTPEVRNGYLYPNDGPGLGIDIDEQAAARWPCATRVIDWTQTRWPDGTPVRP